MSVSTQDYQTNGAVVGCEGEGRLPTFGDNDPSVSEFGYEVADEILSWIKMGIYVGPLSASELPFHDFTMSPTQTV